MHKILILAAALIAPPLLAQAHGTPPAPTHGGVVVEDSTEHWVECVIKGNQIAVFVVDADKLPIPSAQLAGKATVLAGSKILRVTLAPGAANSLTGLLTEAALGHTTVVLSLTIGGVPSQSRVVLVP